MKKEELKKAFDAVSPTIEQKEKMLANIINEGKVPTKRFVFKKELAVTAIAAVMVLAVGFFSIAYLNNIRTSVAPIATTVNSKNASQKVQEISNIVLDEVNDSGEPVEETSEKQQQNTEEVEDQNAKSMPTENSAQTSTDTEAAKRAEPQNSEEESDALIKGSYAMDKVIPSVPVYGAGHGGGGGAALSRQTISLEQIQSHKVYSMLLPSYTAMDFQFNSATMDEDKLQIFWYNSNGKQIKLMITKNYDGSTVSPQGIQNMEGEQLSFALACGEYYSVYYAETDNKEELHKMVSSATYFN